uniref:Uncharacterized protein n=1 Tax=Caenorhabditis japonica TaxID=281687 RepID=A0A8R1ESK5_CAEJA
MPGLLLPEDFHIKPEELLNDARRSYWFIAKYRTRTRVLSAPQPFMELGQDYDITKKKRVMAKGLMRPVLIRTQKLIPLQRNPGMVVALLPQLMPLQLARGIRLGHHRQRFMRLTAALSQRWIDGSPSPVITIFFSANGLLVNQSIAFINNESMCKPSGPTLNNGDVA